MFDECFWSGFIGLLTGIYGHRIWIAYYLQQRKGKRKGKLNGN
jgi:hypothetical protein